MSRSEAGSRQVIGVSPNKSDRRRKQAGKSGERLRVLTNVEDVNRRSCRGGVLGYLPCHSRMRRAFATVTGRGSAGRENQDIAQALMIALVVIMRDELADRSS